MQQFNDKVILITGGTGSLGQKLTKYFLKNTKAKKIIVLSRDELKQVQMAQELSEERLRFFIGDVRDLPRLQRAFYGVDIVIHTAALKQVPVLEYNPFEAIKTNIQGSQNVIEAAIDQKVKKVILVSTDKAAAPVNLYGVTKLAAEKIFIDGNSYGASETLFSAVRYGNVIASRGSIIDLLLSDKYPQEKIGITDPEMTRFWITMDQAIQLIIFALDNMEGGEIFIPKIPSMKLTDLFESITPGIKREIIGIRPGEKIHEELLTEHESRHTYELPNHYVIIPEFLYFREEYEMYQKYKKEGKPLPKDFKFSSNTNKQLLTKDQLTQIIEGLRKQKAL